jgi:hypothetical protein
MIRGAIDFLSSLPTSGVSTHCLFLKNIEDARRLRKQVTQNFEAADLPVKSDEDFGEGKSWANPGPTVFFLCYRTLR